MGRPSNERKKLDIFNDIATRVRKDLIRYWDDHALPLATKFVLPRYSRLLPADSYVEFKDWLFQQPHYCHVRSDAFSATVYMFPPLAASRIDEVAVNNCMLAVDRLRRERRNIARKERSLKAASQDETMSDKHE